MPLVSNPRFTMKVVVVGCGSIGARHAHNSARLAKVGVVDTVVEKARTVAREGDICVFRSIEDALAWQPDAAIVATPHTTHIEIAARLVSAQIPVLIEKPIAERLDGVDGFLDQAMRRRVPVYVVCNMRFHPAVDTLRQHVSEIGTPYFARAHYGNYLPDMRPGTDYRHLYCAGSDGGGVILDAIHEIDYLTWIFGDASSVTAVAGKLSDLDISVEDYASLSIVHANGARSEIHLDYLQRFKRRGCEVVGSEGTLLWSSQGKNPEDCTVRLFTASDKTWRTLYDSRGVDVNEPYVKLVSAFFDSVRGKPHATLLTGAQAKRVLQVALMAKSAALSQPAARVTSSGSDAAHR